MIGTYIGQYKVVRLLGEGGMGQVYEGLQEQLGRRVAIKLLHAEYARTKDVLSRFFNEARAVNVIAHPGLVQISEFGQRPDGCAYLVMEYLEGETLGARLQRLGRQLPEAMAVHLARQLASALEATHAKEIVHRDLKPSNIMMVPDPVMPGGERVKLLDFGIAKSLGEQGSSNDAPKTRTGMILGTPLYMSPEQCRGAALDGKADVYSLGIILYQMLAGQLPFRAENDMAVIAMHLMDQPPPLRKLAPQVSKPMAALVHELLAKDKSERPSMKEVHAQLSRLDVGRADVEQLRSPPAPASAPPRSRVEEQPPTLTSPSTMHNTSGQLAEPRRKLPRFTVAGISAVVTGAALLFSVRSLTRHDPPRASTVARPPSVRSKPEVVVSRTRWVVASNPAGAEIVRAEDSQLVGKTPWESEQPRGSGTTQFILRYPGYRERSIVADRSQSGEWQESLEQLPAKPAPRTEPQKPASKGAPKQNPCPKDQDCSARAKRGMELYQAKHYDQALKEFQTAYTLTQDAPRLLIHIGLCIQHLGRAKQALQYYQSYLRADPHADADTRSRVNSYIAEASAVGDGDK